MFLAIIQLFNYSIIQLFNYSIIQLFNYSMDNPYFNSHFLYPNVQKAYKPAVSSSGSVLNDYPQRNGTVFGLKVQQTTPNNHLNTLNPYGDSFHNPFSDYRFPKALVRVIYHQEPERSELLGLSDKTKAQQSDENILYTSQSGLRIDRVWSMAVKAHAQSHSINANHPQFDSTLKNTAGNSFSGMGQSTPQVSIDNNLHQPVPIPGQDRIETFSKPEAPVAMITPQLNSEKCQQNRSSENEFDFNASASVSGESLTSSPDKDSQKAYRESEKGKATRKAYRKAYEQSEKRKAYRKAYEQSEKRKVSRKAYLESDKGKATRKAYRESEQGKAYQKAYYEVFKNTGDREQAKIAGKQATAFIRESNKAKNSELESISIFPLPPPPLRLTGKSIIEG
ncbi:hypothetical protein [Endozoicomonas sp. SCSIO W0465]|uniref:hypothetical protein n=1 Tax=Endozoicomonas sp. SCSIO W0465 TaxID=2918516 RepID=UPI002075C32A|nr:hypothetical protein [Endozoicomonas sp. SCSIO W0465]USE33738.1 hypothetical protein MJO57_16230 [Endozoicomonas sp. SCSIO W0465]